MFDTPRTRNLIVTPTEDATTATTTATTTPTCATTTIAPAPGELAPARCADGTGALTSLFFSDDPVDIARAKAICRRCDRRERCLDDALARGEHAGVWGGELLSFGEVVALKRPCGRPPKHPRPELFVDELGEFVDDTGDGRAVPVFATVPA